jgi:hypothetical protein
MKNNLQENTWLEVYKTCADESTETIAMFLSLKDASDFVDNWLYTYGENLNIDSWSGNGVSIPRRIGRIK